VSKTDAMANCWQSKSEIRSKPVEKKGVGMGRQGRRRGKGETVAITPNA